MNLHFNSFFIYEQNQNTTRFEWIPDTPIPQPNEEIWNLYDEDIISNIYNRTTDYITYAPIKLRDFINIIKDIINDIDLNHVKTNAYINYKIEITTTPLDLYVTYQDMLALYACIFCNKDILDEHRITLIQSHKDLVDAVINQLDFKIQRHPEKHYETHVQEIALITLGIAYRIALNFIFEIYDGVYKEFAMATLLSPKSTLFFINENKSLLANDYISPLNHHCWIKRPLLSNPTLHSNDNTSSFKFTALKPYHNNDNPTLKYANFIEFHIMRFILMRDWLTFRQS